MEIERERVIWSGSGRRRQVKGEGDRQGKEEGKRRERERG